MTEVAHDLAIRLIDELEALDARLRFYIDQDDEIKLEIMCSGVVNYRRCRQILKIGLVSTDYGDAFRDELEERYLAGRLRMFPLQAQGAQ